MNARFCMSAYTYGRYTSFVPTYAYSVLSSYPGYTVRIFTPDTLDAGVSEQVARIRALFPGRLDILERFTLGTVNDRSPHCRWLIPHSCFEDVDFAYMGDIDFIIVREDPGLLESHLEHCRSIRLPYSNVVRRPPLQDRITGLHFMKVGEYFQAMSPVIDRWKERDFTRLDDEELLYLMIREAIGLPPADGPEFRPHHGFHLGLFRVQTPHLVLPVWKTYDTSVLKDPVLRELAGDHLIANAIDALNGFRQEWEAQAAETRLLRTELAELRERLVRAVCRPGKEVVVWGAGEGGRLARTWLQGLGLNPRSFVDSDTAKAGLALDGVPVVAPSALSGQYRDKAAVVVASMAHARIAADLQALGWREDFDFCVVPPAFLAALRPGSATGHVQPCPTLLESSANPTGMPGPPTTSGLNDHDRHPSAVSPIEANRLPRVLLLADRRGWYFDTNARALRRHLADRFQFEIAYVAEEPDLRDSTFDLILVYFWGETYHRRFVDDPRRVVKLVASHRWALEAQYGCVTPGEMAARYLADAGTVIALSRRLQQVLSPHRFSLLVPDGYEPSLFHHRRARTGGLKIGWAGNANDPCKGLLDVILPAAGDDFSLLTAGGSVSHQDMRDFYNEVDVLCVASTAEGGPLPLIESMACGCFPVAVDVGVVPELVVDGQNGLIVARQVEAFRSAFRWCADNLEFVRASGRQNAEVLPRLRSWETTARFWERALRLGLDRCGWSAAAGLAGERESASGGCAEDRCLQAAE